MTRLRPIPEAEMSPEVAKEWASLLRWRQPATPGEMGGPFDAWLRSPEMSNQMRRLAGFFWERTCLDRGIVELAIDVCAAHWQSNYEWNPHASRAIEYGIPASVIDDLREGRAPQTDRSDIQVTVEVCTALLNARSLSQSLYERAVAEFTERGLVEICGTIGTYTTVAFTLRAFEIEPAEGQPRPFARPAEG